MTKRKSQLDKGTEAEQLSQQYKRMQERRCTLDELKLWTAQRHYRLRVAQSRKQADHVDIERAKIKARPCVFELRESGIEEQRNKTQEEN